MKRRGDNGAARSGGTTIGRRGNRRERGEAAKVAERGEKMRLFRTSRRCENFPVCPPTSATGHPAAAHFRGRTRELNPPAAAIPFLRFRWGAGRPMKRPTAPRFPAVAKTFFKISLGVGRPMKRPTAPHFPAAAIPFFKISLGGGTTHEAANRTPLPGCGQNLF